MALELPDQGGGGGGAAVGTFSVGIPTSSIQVYGAGLVRDAVTLPVTELTYGIAYQFTMARVDFDKDGPQYWAELYSGWIQELAAWDHTIGLTYTQDVNPSGNLTDFLIVTVGPDGQNDGLDVLIELTKANDQASFAKLSKAYKSITDAMALT